MNVNESDDTDPVAAEAPDTSLSYARISFRGICSSGGVSGRFQSRSLVLWNPGMRAAPITGGAWRPADFSVRWCVLVASFLAPLGIYVGQVAYMEIIYGPSLRPGDPVFLPAFISVALFGLLPAIAGAVLAFVVYLIIIFVRSRPAAGRGS